MQVTEHGHSLSPVRLFGSARRRLAALTVAALVAGLVSIVLGGQAASAASAGSPCGATINPIVCENQQQGTPETTWDVTGSGDSTIQGFSTDISVNAGATVQFKIDTPATSYTIDIYRLGYYGGDGARKVTSITPSAHLPQVQPPCATDQKTTLVDCGTWGVSASWAVPSTAVSGVYLAHLTRTDTTSRGASLIPFVVRNDAGHSDVLYQTSDPTWEAYNRYGGADFYTGSDQNLWDSPSRARKLSYNRPFATRDDNEGRDFLFANEYPTIRFMEENGYDVSYMSGVDTDRYGATLLTNHKVFLSVGHDEYWSQAQRTNVEKARDAGVNLMFLSGNEVYWHTRYEPSIDGTNTPYRTLVDYKETWDNAPTDPTGESTATWRDPRFGASPGGGNPENALTGTMYMANSDDLALSVTQAQGKTRIWRGTGLNTMSTSSTALAPHTVGYESDEDVDNGFRPAGLIDLSTTVGSTPQELQDFGVSTAAATTTHHITLYRASSGALVFSAGTIQWSWGLDEDHDGSTAPADSRMQQATVNMLADMHVQPSTLMAGLVGATASTDTQAPTSTITSPRAATTLANGSSITVTGTASDVGGVVAGVEVSIDGGATWHPATGTTSWSYTGIVTGDGPVSIKSRATDDSANTQSPPTSVSITTSCPCSLFGSATPGSVGTGQGATSPSVADSGDAGTYELGVRFTSETDGHITGIRFYKSAANTGTHFGTLWTSTGTQLATGTFTAETASGWQTLQFATPVAVTANTTYVASYYDPNGHYSLQPNFFYYQDYNASPLHAQSNSPADASKGNGVLAYSHAFPATTYSGSNYYVDVLYTDDASFPPVVSSQTPAAGATSVATTVAPTATFSKDINTSTLVFKVTDSSNNSVAGATTYNASTRTATFTPSTALAAGALYNVSVTASDTNGNAMATPVTWNFRTAFAGQVGNTCPCSILGDSWTPAIADADEAASVELGTKFSTDTDGVITGVRFYKGVENIGTHTGSLWTSTGTLLATATFTSESSTGWQTVSFSSPVAVSANTTYIVSYHTSTGYYAMTSGAFATTGVDVFPLHVPVHGAVYTYAGGFPSLSSDTNYGVDAVFTVPASVVPTVTATNPAAGGTGVLASTTVTAAFSTSVLAGTPSVTMQGSNGSTVTGTVALDAPHRLLTFTPSASLSGGVIYTVTISGARTLTGAPQSSPYSWSFTTSGVGTCPCSLFPSTASPATADSGEAAALSLGVQFTANTNGYVSGVKFYKSSANTGVHTGSLWSSTGARLATATFSNETASGWQTVTFSQAVAVTAGTTYTASYYTTTGHYSFDANYFAAPYANAPLSAPSGNNGVFLYGSDGFPTGSYNNANYWVDVVFQPGSAPDTTPPSVTATTPVANATGVAPSTSLTAKFSEPVTAGSINFKLVNSSNQSVTGTTTYDATSQTATFTPGAALAAGAFTASVSATDTAGNAMTGPTSWSFTTAGVCPCTLFATNAVPANLDSGDAAPVNLGVTFVPATNGYIAGVRFYKSTSNTGTHTATLWSAAGVALANLTFAGESATGWQNGTFATPVPVTAGTTYVVSYLAPNGGYSYDPAYFATAYTNGPLTAPAGNNGVFIYGANSAFPTGSYNSTNYWVDPLFVTTPPADTTPPAISAVAATGTNATGTITWTTDEPSTSRVDYGTSATALTSSATSSGLSTSHSVALTGLTGGAVYYRVTSVDTAGNSATAPATSGPAASFTPADTIAPTIAAVTATSAGTTATVTWTTNEPGTSVVNYGTSATALTSTASVSGSVTSHSVTLSGLVANTRYYYRVTSADPSGNSATSPATSGAAATFAPAVAPLSDSTFAGGTASSTYVTPGTSIYTAPATNSDGEVILNPTSVAEFAGSTLPSGWSTSSTSGTTVAGGTVSLSGATLSGPTSTSTNKSLQVLATLNKNQTIGWTSTAALIVPKAYFSLNSSGQLIATATNGLFTTNTSAALTVTGAVTDPHTYRIDTTSTAVTFYVDDVQKYTTSIAIGSSFKPQLADTSTTDGFKLVADWVRVTPFTATGTFTSKVLDAGAPVIWDGLSWTATVPAGTTLTVKVRTGNTATPDGTWTAFTTVSTSGASVGTTSRYLQYQITLTSTTPSYVTPTLAAVTVAAHL